MVPRGRKHFLPRVPFDMVSRPELFMKKIALVIFLLMTIVSGCSVLAASRSFYGDLPPSRINWREYNSD